MAAKTFQFRDYLYHAVPPEHRAALAIFQNLIGQDQFKFTSFAELLNTNVVRMPDSDVCVWQLENNKYAPYQPVMSNLLSHGRVSADWCSFTSRLLDAQYRAEVQAALGGVCLATDTMTLSGCNPLHSPQDQLGEDALRYAWTHSPVAHVDMPWDSYLLSLKKKRRDNLKTAMRKWSDARFAPDLLSLDEVVNWALPNIYRKHPFGASHAANLFLYGHAASLTGFGQTFTLRVDGQLRGAMAFIDASDGFNVFHSFVKDESSPSDNIGQAMLGYAMRWHCDEQNTITHVDPTCITQPFEDVLSIDTYKRMVVNTSAYRPCYMAAFDDAYVKGSYPPYFDGVQGVYVSEPELTWSPERFPDLREA